MKLLPKTTELFHADGQTDMTPLVVAFSNVVNAPKITAHNNLSQQNNADCS